MKTAIRYKALAFILLPAILFANNPNLWKGKHTKTKTINKEFSVNSDATVQIKNSYGDLNIITWNENRVVFEITITTNGNDAEKVQKKLDNIDVGFQASSSFVSAKTTFGKSNSNSWWNWGKKSKVNMKINYVVKMPATNNVDLNNDYGSINLDKLEGHAKINCDYGKITTKELMADNNDINFDYTKHCHFEYIKSGKINADYSGFTIAKSNNIHINADYTNSKIEYVEDITYNADYGEIIIENANNITGQGDYITTTINNLFKSASINADYGSVKIKSLTKGVENININSDYAGIVVGYNSDSSFSFNIALDYGKFNGNDDLVFSKKNVGKTSKSYIGSYGNSSSAGSIKINSDYGSVTFNKN